jgi:hypothetical protein
MFNARVTPSMIFYGVFAAAGAVVPWYFNIKYMQESGELLTPQAWPAFGSLVFASERPPQRAPGRAP